MCYAAKTANNQRYTGDHWKLSATKEVQFSVKAPSFRALSLLHEARNDAHLSFFTDKKITGAYYEPRHKR